jgi:hypothetical protein
MNVFEYESEEEEGVLVKTLGHSHGAVMKIAEGQWDHCKLDVRDVDA